MKSRRSSVLAFFGISSTHGKLSISQPLLSVDCDTYTLPDVDKEIQGLLGALNEQLLLQFQIGILEAVLWTVPRIFQMICYEELMIIL